MLKFDYNTFTPPAPLSAKLIPAKQSVDVGKSALLNCSVMGHPITSIIWEKDHRRLKPGYGHQDIRLLAKDLIHIDSVEKEHRGMYQCFVYNDYESVQATAEITLGGKRLQICLGYILSVSRLLLRYLQQKYYPNSTSPQLFEKRTFFSSIRRSSRVSGNVQWSNHGSWTSTFIEMYRCWKSIGMRLL